MSLKSISVHQGPVRATKRSKVIKNQGGGEFGEEILTPNLHFNPFMPELKMFKNVFRFYIDLNIG